MAKYDVKRLMDFFFEAATETYASGKKAELLGGGAKMFRYGELGVECGPNGRNAVEYRDTYVVNGEWSGGQTLIYVDEVPVWMMQYQGWCKGDDKEVLPFLKKVLFITYMAKDFNGGRGPNFFQDHRENGLAYENLPYHPDNESALKNFIYFRGHERIWRKPEIGTEIFWHRYQGMLLCYS